MSHCVIVCCAVCSPILVAEREGLGLVAPPPGFSAHSISQALGPDHLLDIIDCHRQRTCRMAVEQFCQVSNTRKEFWTSMIGADV